MRSFPCSKTKWHCALPVWLNALSASDFVSAILLCAKLLMLVYDDMSWAKGWSSGSNQSYLCLARWGCETLHPHAFPSPSWHLMDRSPSTGYFSWVSSWVWGTSQAGMRWDHVPATLLTSRIRVAVGVNTQLLSGGCNSRHAPASWDVYEDFSVSLPLPAWWWHQRVGLGK